MLSTDEKLIEEINARQALRYEFEKRVEDIRQTDLWKVFSAQAHMQINLGFIYLNNALFSLSQANSYKKAQDAIQEEKYHLNKELEQYLARLREEL